MDSSKDRLDTQTRTQVYLFNYCIEDDFYLPPLPPLALYNYDSWTKAVYPALPPSLFKLHSCHSRHTPFVGDCPPKHLTGEVNVRNVLAHLPRDHRSGANKSPDSLLCTGDLVSGCTHELDCILKAGNRHCNGLCVGMGDGDADFSHANSLRSHCCLPMQLVTC